MLIMRSSGFWLLVRLEVAQVRSCYMVIVSILNNTSRSHITSSGIPDTNSHTIHRPGTDPPTDQVKRRSSAKKSVFPVRSRHAMNWSNALKEPDAYAVTRACFICSASDLCYLLSYRYMAIVPPLNCSSRIRSILFMSHSSQTNSTFSIRFMIGKLSATGSICYQTPSRREIQICRNSL